MTTDKTISDKRTAPPQVRIVTVPPRNDRSHREPPAARTFRPRCRCGCLHTIPPINHSHTITSYVHGPWLYRWSKHEPHRAARRFSGASSCTGGGTRGDSVRRRPPVRAEPLGRHEPLLPPRRHGEPLALERPPRRLGRQSHRLRATVGGATRMTGRADSTSSS